MKMSPHNSRRHEKQLYQKLVLISEKTPSGEF